MGLTFNELPVELLLIIFLLVLPMNMKTLVLLRTVCTLWNRIISSKHFIQIFLSRQRTSSNTYRYFLLRNASKSKSLVDGETHICYRIFGKNYECYGICDGLFCLSSTKACSKVHSKILLWNPIFRRKLPPLKTIDYSQRTHLLFGYHDGDYKVLKFIFLSRRCYVCIYSLSTDNWKVLTYVNFVSSTFNPRHSKARLVNGFVYIVEDSYKYDRGILSLDLSCEIFQETKLPVDIWYNNDFILEEYRGSLALIGCVLREHEYFVVLWVLRASNGNSFSWDEMSVIKEESNTFQPMGFINKDELVIWSATCGYLHNVKNETRHQLFAIPETRAIMLQSSSTVKSSISVGVVATLGNIYERMYLIEAFSLPIRKPKTKPKMKEVALTHTSNSYDVLADSDSDDDLFR